MAAVNDILIAVKATLLAAFPGPPQVPVFVRRASEMNPVYAQDMDLAQAPVWAISCNARRPTSMAFAGASGPMKFVKYEVEATLLTVELPGERDANTALAGTIETTLAAAAGLFLASRTSAGKPGLQGAPEVNTCEVEPQQPYKIPFEAQTVNASTLLLTFETIEPA